MRRSIVLLAVVTACHPQHQPRPGAVEPLVESTADPAAARAPEPAPAPALRLVPFTEPVELDATPFRHKSVSRFLPNHAVMRPPGDARDFALLQLDTLAVLPLPVIAADRHPGRMGVTPVESEPGVLADIVDEDSVTLFLLRVARPQWEEIGRFDLPPTVVLPDDAPKAQRASVSVDGDHVRLTLTDTSKTVVQYELDRQSLVWAPYQAAADDAPCIMSNCGLEPDIVRWGMNRTDAHPDCVAVRTSESEPWTQVRDPNEELLIVRHCRWIDSKRVLVSGGVRFQFPPFTQRVDVLDITTGVIRPLGEPNLGVSLNVPGELVWIQPGQLTRFDRVTEQFTAEPAPEIGFESQWWVKLDDLTVLYARTHGAEPPRFAKLGLRAQAVP